MVSDDSNLIFFEEIILAPYLIRFITSHIIFYSFPFWNIFIKISFNEMPSYGIKEKVERISFS